MHAMSATGAEHPEQLAAQPAAGNPPPTPYPTLMRAAATWPSTPEDMLADPAARAAMSRPDRKLHSWPCAWLSASLRLKPGSSKAAAGAAAGGPEGKQVCGGPSASQSKGLLWQESGPSGRGFEVMSAQRTRARVEATGAEPQRIVAVAQ